MSEGLHQEEMSYVLTWHPFSRSSDLPEAFGQFSKELEVVSRSRGGKAAIDMFTGRGVEKAPHIAKTILQSVVFSLTDIFDLCLEQSDKIEELCKIEEDDVTCTVKGLVQKERVVLHFGPLPELFDSLCEYQTCRILARVMEMWIAVQFARSAHALIKNEPEIDIEKKKMNFLTYIASELSEEPLIIDDDLIGWISDEIGPVVSELQKKYDAFKGYKVKRLDDFLYMTSFSTFYTRLYNEIFVISEIVYASFGSSSRWDQSPLVLPIVMMSAGALSSQRMIQTVFKKLLPENSPRMRAHKRLMLKLFPA